MSSESNKIPSSEEIIQNITSDLENNVTLNNTRDENESNNSASSKLDDDSGIPKDFEESDVEEDAKSISDDFIDEVALKDAEISLSLEELKQRHEEALNLKNKGNQEYKQENYLESIITYTEALRLCPLQHSSDRAVLYANRAASKTMLDRKQSAIEDCSKAIELNDTYIKAYLRRAKLYEQTEKLDECLEDYKKVLELDPGIREAREAQVRLPPKIEERNEKLKEEMFSKLKDLGNMVLRPFGLSTDNFQMNQDPNTGGYSINFKQNP